MYQKGLSMNDFNFGIFQQGAADSKFGLYINRCRIGECEDKSESRYAVTDILDTT